MSIVFWIPVVISVSISVGNDHRAAGAKTIEELIGPYADYVGLSYRGYVISISRDEITVQRIAHPPRKYQFSDFLKNGGYHHNFAAYMYRIDDVKLGDVVTVKFNRKNRIETAQFLSIYRRPWGRVPPSHQSPNDLGQWHEMANARQDLEMYGIPIPERLLPPKPLTAEQLQQLRNSVFPPPIRIPEPLVVRK